MIQSSLNPQGCVCMQQRFMVLEAENQHFQVGLASFLALELADSFS